MGKGLKRINVFGIPAIVRFVKGVVKTAREYEKSIKEVEKLAKK